MKIKLFFLIVFTIHTTIAQNSAVIKSEIIQSEILNQQRELLIYTPEGYAENKYTHYDVIYIFDAQNRMLFDYVHAILGFLDTNGKDFIIVGITSPYFPASDYARNNDMLPPPRYTKPEEFYNGYSGNANNFLDFIENEVMTYVDSNYRTLGNNLAIGHSLSASLLLYSIISKSNLFNDIIAISPNLAFDNERLVEDFQNFDDTKIKEHSFLYTSIADEGTTYWNAWKPAYEKFNYFINNNLNGKTFEYVFENFPENSHWNTYPVSVEAGLNAYFKYLASFSNTKISNEKIEVTITVKVPENSNDVYITGNQEALGNWSPNAVLMEKTSAIERSITLELQLPAELKFTRGNWNTEALLIGSDEFNGTIGITSKENIAPFYEIENWMDELE